MSKIIALDWETYFSRKLRYTLRLQHAEQYCKSPLFDPYLVAISDGTETWAGSPKDLNWSLLEGATLLSHNAAFDRTVYGEMLCRGWAPAVPYKEWICTANLSAFLCNRRSLAEAAEHLLKAKLDKAPRDKAEGKHWADFSESEKIEMLAYARSDAQLCWEIFDKFGSQWPINERRISELTVAAGMRGIQVDTVLLDKYLIETWDMKQATEKLLPWLSEEAWDEADEFNIKPTSTKCVAEQCRRVGIPCPPVASKDQDGYDEWEAHHAPNHPWILALSSWRSVNKLLKTFTTMKERLRDDGTMPFGQRYCGTHTGRVSGESRVNLFNQRKQAVLRRQDGLMETDTTLIDEAHKVRKKTGVWPEGVRSGTDFRNLIIPRPGFKMITSDASQIEPRVAAWLAGDTAFLDLVSKGFSPYHAHAVTTMGWTGGNLRDADEKLYALAKARLLSLNFGAGFEKLIVMAKAVAGLDLTADDPQFVDQTDPVTGEVKQVSGYGTVARKTVKDYRESNPKIVETWARLENAFRRSIGGDFELRLPSGRVMRYEAVRAECRIEPDKETKKPRKRTVFTCVIGGRRTITYGSKLFENAVQATAREIFYYHVLKLHDAGFLMLIGPYDEAVLEISIDNPATASDVAAIMSQSPPWMPGIPLSAEAKEIAMYQK